MKLKTKLLVVLLVVLTIICVCNTVKATDEVFTEDDEYIQNILNAIPDSMDLDIKESEYEKAQSLVEENVNEAFASKQVDTSEVEIEVSTNGINYTLLDDINNFYKANVRITYLGVDGTEHIEKEINIKYNNTDNHNQADKEYIDSLSFVNKDYFAVDFEDWKKIANNREAYQEYIWGLVGNYYTEQINDNSVQAKIWVGIGDPNGPFSSYITYDIAVFKDDMLYRYTLNGSRTFRSIFVIDINVPSNVADNEVNNYVTNLLQNNSEYSGIFNSSDGFDYNVTVKSIVKGTDENIENGYTVTYEYTRRDTLERAETTGVIIINREQPTAITTTDTETNVKLDTTTAVVPADTQLVVKEVTTGSGYNKVVNSLGNEVNNFVTYDITLQSNGVEIQPNESVKISLPIPDNFNKANLVVYRVDEDGTKTQYDVTVDGNYATFETDHFSTYVLAERAVVDTNSNELDDTPKTGVETNGTLALVITTVLSLAGVVLVKKF